MRDVNEYFVDESLFFGGGNEVGEVVDARWSNVEFCRGDCSCHVRKEGVCVFVVVEERRTVTTARKTQQYQQRSVGDACPLEQKAWLDIDFCFTTYHSRTINKHRLSSLFISLSDHYPDSEVKQIHILKTGWHGALSPLQNGEY